MYNRYIPNGTAYTRVLEEDEPPRPLRPEPEPAAAAPSAPEPAQPCLLYTSDAADD